MLTKKSIITQKTTSGLLTVVMVLMGLVTAFSVSMAWDTVDNNNVIATGEVDATPVGTSIKGYWTSAPQGYLLENGQAVSRATYANLFDMIGTTYGNGDGSTTFNLPDSRGRIVVAKSSSESEFNLLAETGGQKNVTLTSATMPSHQHDFAGVVIAWGTGGGNIHFRETEGSDDYYQAVGGNTAGTQVYTNYWSSTNNRGSGGSHNNLQPYIAVYRAIKF